MHPDHAHSFCLRNWCRCWERANVSACLGWIELGDGLKSLQTHGSPEPEALPAGRGQPAALQPHGTGFPLPAHTIHLLSHPSCIPCNCSGHVNGMRTRHCTGILIAHVLQESFYPKADFACLAPDKCDQPQHPDVAYTLLLISVETLATLAWL